MCVGITSLLASALAKLSAPVTSSNSTRCGLPFPGFSSTSIVADVTTPSCPSLQNMNGNCGSAWDSFLTVPSDVTNSIARTLSRRCPLDRLLIPRPPVAIHPPTVENLLDGHVPTRNPCFSSSWSRSAHLTPACTVAVLPLVSISTIRSMPDMSSTRPPVTGTHPPNGDDAEPLGMTGTPAAEAAFRTFTTASVDSGCATTSGTVLKSSCLMNLGISDWSLEYNMRSPSAVTILRSSLGPRSSSRASAPSGDSSLAENSFGGEGGPLP